MRTALGAGVLAVTLAVLWLAFTVSMRAKYQPVQDAVRKMNRAVANPRTMKTAGQPGAGAAVVRHVGRKTGTLYATPVEAHATDDGFLISLPYGSRSDWLQNVLAAGTAEIVHEGTVYPVDRPEIVSADVAWPQLPPRELRSHRWFGIDDYLQIWQVEPRSLGST